jgi:hypothetical protein
MAGIILEKYGRENAEILSSLEDLLPKEIQKNRPEMSKLFRDLFSLRRWDQDIDVFDEPDLASGKISFMKGRVGVQISFNHYLRIGTELLRFQALSYSSQNLIDVGVYISITEQLVQEWSEGFLGSITFERACRYYEEFRNAITIPIVFIGLLPDD